MNIIKIIKSIIKKLPPILVSFLISISLIGSSYADFQDGVNAYDQGEFVKAFYEFEPLAENGIADAQYYLGYMFLKGKAPEEKRSTLADTTLRPKNDLRNAFPWLEKAKLLFKQKHYKECIHVLRYITHFQDNKEALFLITYCYLYTKHSKGFNQCLKWLNHRYPNHPKVLELKKFWDSS